MTFPKQLKMQIFPTRKIGGKIGQYASCYVEAYGENDYGFRAAMCSEPEWGFKSKKIDPDFKKQQVFEI